MRVRCSSPFARASAVDARSSSLSALPARFAQAFEHVFVVLWPVPWRPLTGVEFELARRTFEHLLQCCLRLFCSTQLTQRSGQPPVSPENGRMPSQRAPRCLGRPRVVTLELVRNCEQVHRHITVGTSRVDTEARREALPRLCGVTGVEKEVSFDQDR
jgi:hypothetical protein